MVLASRNYAEPQPSRVFREEAGGGGGRRQEAFIVSKPISTKTHGAIDYLSVPLLVAAPRLFGWSPAVTRYLTVAAAGTLAYSLLTRYEFGAKPVLPMGTHLALDGVNGALTLAAPWLLGETSGAARAALMGMGAFELGASLLTDPEPRAMPVDPTSNPAEEALPSPS